MWMRFNVRACRSGGNRIASARLIEAKLNIFLYSSVFGQLDMQPKVAKDQDLFVATADEKPRCCAFVLHFNINFALMLELIFIFSNSIFGNSLKLP